jgi:hypothetical protein
MPKGRVGATDGVLVKMMHFWLPLCAALALSAPLAAQQLDAPPVQDSSLATSVLRARLDPTKVAQPADTTADTESSVNFAALPDAPQAPAAVEKPADKPADAKAETLDEKSKRQKAEEQIRAQEKQRVLGLVPAFNVSYVNDAVSLTGMQKIRLAFRTTRDPVTIASAFVVAGYHEADNDLSGFSWGPKGYMERVGVVYLDTFDGTMLGNGVLPALLHQDPRYFRRGHGSVLHRTLYSLSTAVVARHDDTGKREPNYSNVLGNLAAGGISNLYYPGNHGIELTISNGLIQTAEGALGSLFQEFWPDISRKVLHKDPTHGRDALPAK